MARRCRDVARFARPDGTAVVVCGMARSEAELVQAAADSPNRLSDDDWRRLACHWSAEVRYLAARSPNAPDEVRAFDALQ